MNAHEGRHPPENEVPVLVPINTFFGRTDDVAVALLGLQVYTTGLLLDFTVRVRSQRGDRGRRMELLASGGGPGPYDDRSLAADRLLFGAEYPDGRVAVNFPVRSGPVGPAVVGGEGFPVLVERGGGGGG